MKHNITLINKLNVRNNPQDVPAKKPTKDKELYSDDEEAEEEEEEEIVKKVVQQPVAQSAPVQKTAAPVPDDDVPDDVEIIDEEQIEEELEEEDDEEEEISDVDDAELLSRLEAKYGRLPEPDRPGQKHSKHDDCMRVLACSCRHAGFIILTN